ncbi:MAG TPA: threonine/serine exporter family protein [Steroidobacteraceae bacterium]|nr:threonine/serine exporter family protein [Steroidobacteraceae bacterium]
MSAPSTTPTTALQLTAAAAALLFENGQTTERTIDDARRLARSLGIDADIFLRWGELIVRLTGDAGAQERVIAAAPTGVDMGKVAATLNVIDGLTRGDMDAPAAESALRAVAQGRSVSDTHFAVFAAAGAVALGVIFGVIHAFAVVVIALSAGVGGYLRRWLARKSHNPLLQPFCAALLAGAVAALALYLRPGEPQRLVAVCPCMVLVPGPHILNGALDLARSRVPLGAARVGYAALIILMICAGLLLGLSLGGATLPVSGPSVPVPLVFDVLAAGVAVAAYGTFFAMPARMLPLPVLVGMLAHSARWAAISIAGASVEVAALLACLIVGIVITPLADRMRMPFAAVAFASVVALIPGVYIFRMAEGFVQLIEAGAATPPGVVSATLADAGTAFLITLAMAFGLLLPKVCFERFFQR